MIDLLGDPWRLAIERGLGAPTVRVADNVVPMPIFRVGPVRVAYAGFPIGIDGSALDAAREIAARQRASVLRVIRSADDPPLSGTLHRYIQPSVLIDDLAGWSPMAHEKARRTRNRRRRSEVNVRASDDADFDAIWTLYRHTVERYGGSVRYSPGYFRFLANAGVLVAEAAGRVIGFVASGRVGHRAFYLHGAHDPHAKALYPSDLLFLEMIEQAQVAGASSFDFLPSPSGQPRLHAYKQSWGGRHRDVATDDVPLNTLGTAFALAYAARAAINAWRDPR